MSVADKHNVVTDLRSMLEGIVEIYQNDDGDVIAVKRRGNGFLGVINESAELKFRKRKDVEKYTTKKGFKFKTMQGV